MKNERIVLIPGRGLCYVSDWPEEPSYDYDGLGHASKIEQYEQALSKALSEAVLIEDVSKDRLWLMIGEVKQEPAFKSKFYGKIYVKENHPYPVPTGYRVEVRNYNKTPLLRMYGEGFKIEKRSVIVKLLAFLMPIEHPKEESQEELWKLALHHSGSQMNPIKWLSEHFTITRTQH